MQNDHKLAKGMDAFTDWVEGLEWCEAPKDTFPPITDDQKQPKTQKSEEQLPLF